MRKSCHKQHSWQNPSIEKGKIKTYQGKMPVGWTTWAKNPPCLLSARPVKTSCSFFFTQLGETIMVEIKLLLELSIHHLQEGSLWSGACFLHSSCWWAQWMNGEWCSTLCRRQAKQIDREVRPHTWNLCNETKIFMEKDTKPAWPTSHEEVYSRQPWSHLYRYSSDSSLQELFLIKKEDK